jgi:methionyl aminopeptidase
LLPGCSLNHVAAHYTPNYGEKAVALSKNDIMKLDFGIQVNGRILDSAFTVAFDPKFEPLVQSTQEGTWAGIKASGVDARSVNFCLHISFLCRC